MKKSIPLLLCLVLVLSVAGCGKYALPDEVLSPLVADAILSDNEYDYRGSEECRAEGHKILGSSISGNRLTVYALTTFGCYGFENDMFIKVSGTGVIPAVITFEANGREYNLLEIEYPRDGAEYTKSIKRMFPLRYRSAVLRQSESVYDELSSQERSYAEAYLKSIGREAKIGEYADLHTVLLTDLGVSVDVSNQLVNDKRLAEYPYWIGTSEFIENGKRYVRSLNFDEKNNIIAYTTYEKESEDIIEKYIFNASTGEELEPETFQK